MMKSTVSRRALLATGIALGATAPMLGLWSGVVNAATSGALDPNDPTAKALGFVSDAKKVDALANPTFDPAQKCSTCAQYQGKASDAMAGCNIFAGKGVPGAGWCKVWTLKSGS